MTLIAIDRAPQNGEVWAVLRSTREEVALGLGWALPVVGQPDESEPLWNAYEGEVVLDHPDYGHVVVQAIDCDYREEV